ncbi:MAG: DNA repair protein RadA [Oscillospiraceae bacterium]|nr:DNA repair protein RadA [Oscillospiraceae bacterium]
MAKQKTAFFCAECGNEFPRWQGQCSMCKAWNSLVEQPLGDTGKKSAAVGGGQAAKPARLSEISVVGEARFLTGMDELDRVLGGGAVAGSLVLVAGEPGIGKSTLLLQICESLCRFSTVLYVSGEESARQIKLRAERLRVDSPNLHILTETDVDDVEAAAGELKPDIIIIDSIQTMYKAGVASAHGSLTQVKECTLSLMRMGKRGGVTIFIVGHVNKEGAVAGPKVLEHMVDCVLYFEGDQQYRILRAAKNRYGATHEIGVFEMLGVGLREVPNPSEALLAGRPRSVPGSCVACTIEGSRPLLAEIQALVTPTTYNYPRRMANGIDSNRAMLLLAILEKRGGLHMGNADAYLNVVGGLTLDETAADLPALLALASSRTDKPVREGLAAFGEVGLAGELRAVSGVEQRLSEVRRLGFTSCIVPYQGTRAAADAGGLEVIRVKHLRQAIDAAIAPE